jgi:hypothetical protein
VVHSGVQSLAKRTLIAVEEASWRALKGHISVYVRLKGRVDGAILVRLAVHRARGRLRFWFSSPRISPVIQLGIPRIFQPCPSGIGWARKYRSAGKSKGY